MLSNDQALRNFTRGGQTLLHNLRMIMQIFDRLAVFCVIFYILLCGVWFYLQTPYYEKYLAVQYGYAQFITILDPHYQQEIFNTAGEKIKVNSKDIIRSPLVQQSLDDLVLVLARAAVGSGVITAILFIAAYYWLSKRGKKQAETKKLRGDEIIASKVLAQRLREEGKISDIQLDDLPFPKDFECGHVLIHGTTGSGKSVCIRELLDQIRKRGDRAIIYDKSCDYVRFYYREGDVILNPLDKRTASWHLWHECRDSADYDSLAAALMPMPIGAVDPFWVNAARTIFAAAARRMQQDENRSTINLLRALLTADLATMENFLRGTEAETLVSEKIEKTAVSIKSVLSTYLKSLKYVKDEANPFSIRQWVQDDTQKNWLFISSLADRHETLKPLISMWLDIAANALMSLTPSTSRRIWIIFDELPSLHKLPYLTEAFAESRKFGGCLVAGMQSISQLRKIYGANAAEEISGLCNTRIFFREPSAETAQWVAKELGEIEVEMMKEGMSYSESAMRSGISMTPQEMNKPLIKASEIMRLNNLEGYVRLPGMWPITKIQLKYKEYQQINAPFIVRKIVEEDLSQPEAKQSEANQSETKSEAKNTEVQAQATAPTEQSPALKQNKRKKPKPVKAAQETNSVNASADSGSSFRGELGTNSFAVIKHNKTDERNWNDIRLISNRDYLE